MKRWTSVTLIGPTRSEPSLTCRRSGAAGLLASKMTRALGTDFSRLIAQVGSREKTAEGLIKTLRELPNKEALALRSEVAVQVGSCVLVTYSLTLSVLLQHMQQSGKTTGAHDCTQVAAPLGAEMPRSSEKVLSLQAAAARAQRRTLEKSIWNIAKRDV